MPEVPPAGADPALVYCPCTVNEIDEEDALPKDDEAEVGENEDGFGKNGDVVEATGGVGKGANVGG